MKTIEERAELNLMYEKDFCGHSLSDDMVCRAYVRGANEQKAIDNAAWLKIKSSWEREAQINHNDEANYQQGCHDTIEKACNIFCYTGCPHKTDSYNCLNDKCDTWKMFRRMMEKQL